MTLVYQLDHVCIPVISRVYQLYHVFISYITCVGCWLDIVSRGNISHIPIGNITIVHTLIDMKVIEINEVHVSCTCTVKQLTTLRYTLQCSVYCIVYIAQQDHIINVIITLPMSYRLL